MREFPSDIVFTPAVKAVQERKGSRVSDARMERGRGWQTTVTPDLAAFLIPGLTVGLQTESPRDQPRERQERAGTSAHAPLPRPKTAPNKALERTAHSAGFLAVPGPVPVGCRSPRAFGLNCPEGAIV
jgi:hypothetical protein